MKLLIYSANLGDFDSYPSHVDQGHAFWCCTDEDFPPRFNAMTPRLQARIVKTHGWQMKPGYDIYLWVDNSTRLLEGAADWMVEQLGDKDMALFRHNRRKTIQEEADYLKHRLAIGCPYVTPRYENEDIDGQLAEVDPQGQLFATTALIYRNTTGVRQALKTWWLHTSRFHSIDQLSLTNAIKGVSYNVIDADYLKVPYLEHTRS